MTATQCSSLVALCLPGVWFDAWDEPGGVVISIHEQVSALGLLRLLEHLPPETIITSDEASVLELWVRESDEDE